MKKPKSSALKNLLVNLKLAQFSDENPEVEMEQIVAFKHADPVSRRKFVSDVAKFSLLTTVVGSSVLTSCKKDSEKKNDQNIAYNEGETPILENKEIAIIGAGIAGLNAAYQLSKIGVKATIYEGSFRLGGRILTHYGDALDMGIHPEFGGDFIDTNHEDMLALAKEFNLELIDMYAQSKKEKLVHETFFFDGRHIPEHEIIKEFKKVIPTLTKDAKSLGENYDTPAAKILDKMPLDEYISKLKCANWLKDIFNAAYLAEFGLSTHQQSAINLLDMIDLDTSAGFKIFGDSDEKYRIKEGNSKIIENLAAKLQGQIQTESILTAIKDYEGGKYLLSFKDKPDVVAQYLIIAIPFNMLKKVDIQLKEMTKEKMNSIQNLGFGQNNKLFLGYNNRPWREGNNKYYGYLFHKTIHDGWDSSSIKSIESNKGVYCCFFGGDESIQLANVATQNPRAPKHHVWKTDLPETNINNFVTQLDQVFPGSKSAYANKHVFACWSSYPFTQGSYTCPGVGQWNNEMLHTAEPIGNIHFAGEHCSVDFQGFMNGGAETGRLAAAEIAKKLKKQPTKA